MGFIVNCRNSSDVESGGIQDPWSWEIRDSYKRPESCKWLDSCDAGPGPIVVEAGRRGNTTRLCNTTGYDFVLGVVTEWLKSNNATEFSMCEAVLLDAQFASVRKHVSIANHFWSHVQMEPFLTDGQRTGTTHHIRFSSIRDSQTIWLDYFGLRQCQKDFDPAAVQELISSIGTLTAAKILLSDGECPEGYLSRSFCIFELAAACQSGARISVQLQVPGAEYFNLVDQVGNSLAADKYFDLVDSRIRQCPVNVLTATARNIDDKIKVDTFVQQEGDGADRINEAVTEMILRAAGEMAIMAEWQKSAMGDDTAARLNN